MSKLKSHTGGLFDPRIRASFSISSWFCIPEEGMEDMEILSRASGFIVKARNPEKFGRNFHFVTVSHTVAPWRWPKYYPDEWLQAVNEKHTHYTIELRTDDGVFVSLIDLLPRSYHHLKRDLAVLHIENEKAIMKDVFKLLEVKADDLYPLEEVPLEYDNVVQSLITLHSSINSLSPPSSPPPLVAVAGVPWP